jgi:hypothetical protein
LQRGFMASGAAAAHAPHAGGCTTWIDDEMEARGLEPPPMTDCCAKDAAQAAEAARVHAILSAADPTRRAVQLRASAAPQARVQCDAPCASYNSARGLRLRFRTTRAGCARQ